MTYDEIECFKVTVNDHIATVTIDYPPINLMDLRMIKALYALAKLLSVDEALRVIIFRSADPDFFIAHADLNLLLHTQDNPLDPERLNLINKTFEMFRTMPKVSIAQIEGQAYGGGSEFALALDMRFAAIGKTRLGQPEVALGIIPGGGGCTRLPELVGRGRALEILLGCETYSAEKAERYGYINQALPADSISETVDALARRIASFPSEAIAAVKRSINIKPEWTIEKRLIEEQKHYTAAASSNEARQRILLALAAGLQQRDIELVNFDAILLQKSGE
ncbi:enoyl-CoA hydratase/isomerase family protein [Spongiibacter sp. KMU-166]|uniref:Enoyl-CoA hydratase/isomerase family protein n=1 Tax=Spongiibacter thalassae TaxID=2721624 RepID=A0ABX1G9K8_9GAMM|nr:enoyl-CoA hydratase/isomerase family protein [Spongiibacter thalassae]NKI15839.1 enoyl-CoA hydratase/isomerase family protein [Spongiibacter thalassae]